MLRRPVGLLPTVLERAGQRGALAQSGMCSGVQAMAMEPCVQTQVQEMLPRAAIAAATPTPMRCSVRCHWLRWREWSTESRKELPVLERRHLEWFCYPACRQREGFSQGRLRTTFRGE